MRIIKPSVTLLENTNNVAHVARCARICRAGKFTSEDKDQQLFDNLIGSAHLSMLRHGSSYYIIPAKVIENGGSDINVFYNDYYENPYVNHVYDREFYVYLFSMNLQFLYEHPDIDDKLSSYLVSEKEFKKHYMSKDLIRHSFQVVTQISTSRELNRVSPNNIVEESTRYCNYSKDKFGNEITICQPHWFDLFDGEDTDEMTYNEQLKILEFVNNTTNKNCAKVLFNCKLNKYDTRFLEDYIHECINAGKTYIHFVNDLEILPQDARGILPLDTATKCIYTYTAAEWKHILDLRYYGKTGAPHPNAKIIAGMIREQLYNLGYTELHE